MNGLRSRRAERVKAGCFAVLAVAADNGRASQLAAVDHAAAAQRRQLRGVLREWSHAAAESAATAEDAEELAR